VGWESLFPIFKDRTEYALIGLLATVFLGYSQLEYPFISLAKFSDTIISAVGGVLLYAFFLRKRTSYTHNIHRYFFFNSICWMIGCMFGMTVFFNYIFETQNSTFIALLIGFLITAGLYKFITLLKKPSLS
jgi:purine-cytosine permease-like protein